MKRRVVSNDKILTLLSYRQIGLTKIVYTEKNPPAQLAQHVTKNHACHLPVVQRAIRAIRLIFVVKNLWAVDGDLGVTSGEVTLGGNNLVVVLAKVHALAGPGVKVSLHIDGAGRALVLTNRPILLKGPGAIDGGLVGTGRLSDLVGRSIRGDGTLVLGLGRGVVGAEVLNDVVLDKGVAGPAVDGKVGVAVVVVSTRVGDGTVSMLVYVVYQS